VVNTVFRFFRRRRAPTTVTPLETLKVSSKSDPNLVAAALAAVLRANKKAELVAIGAGAVNCAVKAIAIARRYVAPEGIDPVFAPSFVDTNIDVRKVTAIKLVVWDRKVGA
jgi:stage V sporulation protein S